eukprot:CCRYP_014062-RA/>CCRYP_014062-RA protein AED:0.35 eAED:0.35 QI:0/-1/0/1/-1/1/1/0/263
MLRRAAARSKPSPSTQQAQPQQAQQQQQTQPLPNPAFQSPSSDELIQRTRLKIPNAHVFKLPPKPHSGGWRGADWRDKVWQGTLKVVERGDETAVLLVDAQEERNIFAVCPIAHFSDSNGVDRCIDSSRYFVLRIQNAQGRHMFIGLAFNERNDAFDFNTALEDSRREKEVERQVAKGVGVTGVNRSVDYRMKEGEKIRVSIPKFPKEDEVNSPSALEGESGSSSILSEGGAAARRRETKKTASGRSGGFLAPSSKDTPSRLA